MNSERILLHSCCGPCSSACIEKLIPDNEVVLFYYNPCINDPSEYERRRDNQKKLIELMNAEITSHSEVKDPDTEDSAGSESYTASSDVRFVEGNYDPDRFEELTVGLESEPEGGKRCDVCFRMRLEEAARKVKELGIARFTTTLTVSSHKDFDKITKIGEEVAKEYGVDYVPYNFKKQDGFKRSIELSKKYGLYRQDYCGCNYSKRDRT